MFKRILSFTLSLILLAFVCGLGLSNAQAQAQTRRGSTRGRTASETPVAEATVILNEQFLNSLLDSVFTNLRPPTYPLALAKDLNLDINKSLATPLLPSSPTEISFQNTAARPFNSASPDCSSVIVLEREMGGVRTVVRFENGQIHAPLAFTGTYGVAFLGCMNFQGWADTIINLEFNRERQTLSARVTVLDINLTGIPSLANGVLVGMVQNSLDQRINPVEILRSTQLSARVPIASAGGALQLRAKDIRPEVVPGALRLHIIYEFIPTP